MIIVASLNLAGQQVYFDNAQACQQLLLRITLSKFRMRKWAQQFETRYNLLSPSPLNRNLEPTKHGQWEANNIDR